MKKKQHSVHGLKIIEGLKEVKDHYESRLDSVAASLVRYNVNMAEKSFYLCTPIDEGTPKMVFLALNALGTVQDDRPIRMYLSTTGGDVEAGLAIYGLLRNRPERIEIVVAGYAYSMGIIILQAADHRIALSDSFLMAHWGHQAIEDNNPDNYDRKIKHQKSLDRKCDQILLDRMRERKPSMTMKKVRDLTKLDWYMNPKTAREYGLIDEIL